jgi:putative transcriptional regulator
MTESLAGKLLVATPDMDDPNFFRTVVFIVEHDDDEGALGLVLNRPSDAAVSDHLPDWDEAAAPPPVVFVGGPVTPEVAIGLVDRPSYPPADWRAALHQIGLIDLATHPGDVGGVARCRVFAGYAGWVVGQLDMEVALGSWFVVDALENDVFTSEPDDLWRSVLRRQDSRLSWFANYPLDPRLN